ncbi:MAG: carboxylating nicotinate-nucleotide diphosphorylase [Bacteroidales bacterium]|nr:carboxylating nicotinate-nucleotide diphosphorylase [Lentimicrobiaceae bacterium]MDD5695387.1 carboxylating nicotinate-nucleotide diphosphorylase [Bacteroidales bacterium]
MDIDQIIQLALQEDIGPGDYTSMATIPGDADRKVHLLVKEAGILAGLQVALKVFARVDPGIRVHIFLNDGTRVKKGDVAFVAEGNAISMLTSERVVLNFMQRLSGIATYTRQMVDRIGDLPARIMDTRKTTPLLRELEKYAVRVGGGLNHRFGLYDMILIKDNHVDFSGGIGKAITLARKYLDTHKLDLKMEIEVRNHDELDEVLKMGGVDRIMLDNFNTADLKRAVEKIDMRYETEASGGITLDTVRDYAETGVDFISVGALTHHIRSLDMSLKAIRA